MRLVMMAGLPGAGKSTLAEGLAGELGAFLFGEQKLFELEEFAEVAHGFRTKVFPDTSMMLGAYERFIVGAEHDTVVFDWSCVGMIEDLPCAQDDRTSTTSQMPEVRADPGVLLSHAKDVRELVDDAILLVLDVPIPVALARVLATRGDTWFDSYTGLHVRRGDEPLLFAASRYWEASAPRRDDIVAAHAAARWQIVHLDAARPADDVLRDALRALRR